MKYAPRKVYIKESGGYAELTYTDFCRRRQADQSYMDKLFIPVQGCLLEVVREQYADFYRDKERWRYLQKLDTNHNLLSLEGFTDSEGNVIDFVVDEAVDVAETVVRAVMVDRLKAALPLLSDSEQTLIQAIFFEEQAGYTQTFEVYGCADCSGCEHKARCLYKYNAEKDIGKNKVMKINEQWETLKEESHANIQSEKGILNH